MDNPELTEEAPDALILPEPDFVDTLSDRALLEYIARNMITPETIMTEFQKQLPSAIESIDKATQDQPWLKPILRMLKHL